uniref:Retroelement n=1 Tax=Oryza sativa subsp. japonica TaxID=39947 RepID=Q8S6X4_ORYSJ|nr:Putative retroelement [Oryza sativa Japonica Group]
MVTSFPLGDILHNREANERIVKWALELMSLDLSFKPRTSIKSQALADFVAEWTECQEDTPVEKLEYWTIHFDGSKRLSGTGAGVVLISPTGERLSYVLWIHFSASHNVAEYEALLHGLRIAEVLKLEDKFDGLELTHVLRHDNEAADRLANFGSKREVAPSYVFVEHLYEPTVPREDVIETAGTQEVSVIDTDWREPFIKFLTKQELPQDNDEAERISRSSKLYVMIEAELATGGFTHLFVAVDKFSKWIEAKPVVTITTDKARDFFINIVHRFGVPNRIIIDGTQFTSDVFKDFCEDFGIKICYASVAHSMTNRQVECANGMVVQGIKARVFDRLRPYAGKWVD